jgi:hypothetical protein
MIHTFLDPSVESQFRIISKSYNFLFGIFIRLLLPSLIVTSSQVRVGSSSSIVLSLAWGQKAYYTIIRFRYGLPVTYFGWPLCLHRVNSASKNLPWEAQWPKCCLYETPYYVAAPIRETANVIARTPPYAQQLPTHLQEPEFFFVHK